LSSTNAATCLTCVHIVLYHVSVSRLVQQAGGQQSSQQQQQQQQQKHASTLLHSRSASSATTVITVTTAAAGVAGNSALKRTVSDRLSPQQSLRLVSRYIMLMPIAYYYKAVYCSS
jgi:L,D-peptidoglycan transpeptidase YkuD (ErfK/YbiS/YcfS/YnhG family)